MTKMNPAVKQKWLTALRSGDYKQGEGQLKVYHGENEYSFCCLGVLCDIHAKETDYGNWLGTMYVDGYGGEDYEVLSERVMNWAGLSDANPVVEVGGYSSSVAEMNDQGHTFEEIAKIIEEQL